MFPLKCYIEVGQHGLFIEIAVLNSTESEEAIDAIKSCEDHWLKRILPVSS